MRLERPHSYLLEQVCRLENQPTLLQTQWQSRKVEGPLLKLYPTIELRWGDQDVPVWICQPNNPSGFDPPRGSPLKDVSGNGGSDHPPSPLWPSIGWEHNKHWRDQRPPTPQSLSPSQTVDSRVIGVCYQQFPWCCLGLTSQTDPDIPDEVNGIERKELAWR